MPNRIQRNLKAPSRIYQYALLFHNQSVCALISFLAQSFAFWDCGCDLNLQQSTFSM